MSTKVIQKETKKWPVVLMVFAVVVVLGIIFSDRVRALFNPVNIVATINNAQLKETDGRTNILILGSDKRVEGNLIESELTDTILIASIGKYDNDVVLISVPRDLWVQTPSGYQTKINAVYHYGGAEELMRVIENVLGIPIHYYGVVTFDLFEESIDILGGIEVNVERAFTDYYYPVEGKETAPLEERYEVVHFEAGPQVMMGDVALKYARSRMGNNGEGTDFARAKRQQNMITAIKEKALSAQTLLNPAKVKDLYDAYSTHVDTNIDFSTMQSFYLLSQEIQIDNVISVVLDDRSSAEAGGLLYAPEDTSLYGGAYVLIPRSGNYNQLHAYVQKFLFGDK